MLGWLNRIREGAEIAGLIARAVRGARDLIEARAMLAKAAEAGDLDPALSRVISAQARARAFEESGR